MTDSKKTAGETTDKESVDTKPADKKPSVKKSSVVKSAKKKSVNESSAKAEKIAKTITSSPTISKAGATTDKDMKSAARKISDLEKKAADDAIRSREGAEDLKARANEAKVRARQKIL